MINFIYFYKGKCNTPSNMLHGSTSVLKMEKKLRNSFIDRMGHYTGDMMSTLCMNVEIDLTLTKQNCSF